MEKNLYFALWAEDINQYLHSGYNSQSLIEIRRALIDYSSVDQDNPKNIQSLDIYSLLQMTGLKLTVSESLYEYRDTLEENTLDFKYGYHVNSCYLK